MVLLQQETGVVFDEQVIETHISRTLIGHINIKYPVVLNEISSALGIAS